MAKWDAFVGPSYTSLSTTIECERLVNFYLERVETESVATGRSKFQWALYGRAGLVNFITGLDAPMRGAFSQDGRVFFVGGSTFYEINADGTSTNRGAVAFDGGRASMCSSGDAGHQMFIVAGGRGYIFDLNTNALTQITSVAFPLAVTMGAYVDGYFVVLARNTNQISICGLFDGLTWSGLDVAQRQYGSDRIAAIIADHRELTLAGTRTTEAWLNSGAANFPLEPMQGRFMEQGAIGSTVTKFDNTIAWVSQSERGGGIVYRASGDLPQRISNHAVEAALAQYTAEQMNAAEAFTEEWLGHTFYVLNIGTAATWVYDAATQQWHERDWWNATTGQYEAARPRVHCYGFNQHLVGDRTTGTIYTESLTAYDDAGVEIHGRRRAPHLDNDGVMTFYDMLEIDQEVGIGITGSPTRIPLGTLRYSNNGTKTWTPERSASLGLPGKYGQRVRFGGLGAGRRRVFEYTITDPVRRAIAGAYLTARKGTS